MAGARRQVDMSHITYMVKIYHLSANYMGIYFDFIFNLMENLYLDYFFLRFF